MDNETKVSPKNNQELNALLGRTIELLDVICQLQKDLIKIQGKSETSKV